MQKCHTVHDNEHEVVNVNPILYVLQLTEQFKTLNPMRQVPAVEIDGVTLSQSVSHLNIHPCNPTKTDF